MNSIELKSISCKGIKSFTLFQKPSIYAAISVAHGSGPPEKRRIQQTSTDHEGGENPEWDDPIRFDFGRDRDRDLVLHFGLHAHGGALLLGGDKLIGEVRVPIADLEAEGTAGDVRHVSYQVRSPESKPNGVLSFSYTISFPDHDVQNLGPPPVSYYPTPPPPPATYYPPPFPVLGHPAGCYEPYPPVGDGYYYPPPPPPPPEQAAYYPPPATSGDWYSAPQEPYGYHPDCCDRGLSGYGFDPRFPPNGYR